MSPIKRDRMSFNQITLDPWTLEQSVRACEQLGIPYIAAWRHKLGNAEEAGKLIRSAGLGVSSLCRGGWFAAPTAAERQAKMDDNRRAIDECVAIGSPLLVMVCGPANGQSMDDTRALVTESIAELAPYAADAGVALGIEPLHPMFAADRSVVVTLGQANDIAAHIAQPNVGVVIDAFHVWWDPAVYTEIARAGKTILGYHVSDWAVPLPGILMGRSIMGDGVIELRRLRQAVEAAGWHGPIEVEIFNDDVWKRADDGVLELICERYVEHVREPRP
jgi:sugar phosphate isomerase/epimerase